MIQPAKAEQYDWVEVVFSLWELSCKLKMTSTNENAEFLKWANHNVRGRSTHVCFVIERPISNRNAGYGCWYLYINKRRLCFWVFFKEQERLLSKGVSQQLLYSHSVDNHTVLPAPCLAKVGIFIHLRICSHSLIY